MAIIWLNSQSNDTSNQVYSKILSDMNDTYARMSSKFAPIMQTGLMDHIFEDMTNSMKAMSDLSQSTQRNKNAYAEEMGKAETNGIQTINDLVVTTEFTAGDAMKENLYTKSCLGKIDGTSVNDGLGAGSTKEADDVVVAAEDLKNITGEDSKEEKYDDSSIIGNSILGNINGNVTEEQEYDDKSTVSNERLKNISGDQTKEQTYDDSSSVNKNGNLQDISGDTTEEQEYEDNVVIGKTVLGSIKDETKKQQMSYIDDSSIKDAVENTEIEAEKDQPKKLESNSDEKFQG